MTTATTSGKIRPVIKWPGGKRHIADLLMSLLPTEAGRLYEPFVGGAAVFFHMKPKSAVLADTNADLINFYQQLQRYPSELANAVSSLPNNEEAYYYIRSTKPHSALDRAARFLYLTTLSFNGLYRVNLQGEFNVPYGHKSNLRPEAILEQDGLADLLAGAEFRHGDFEDTSGCATAGDVVFMDPPYTLAHNNNGFIKYNETIFSWEDQIRLARHAESLRERGVFVLVTNAAHKSVSSLYPHFQMITVTRQSVMAASANHRGPFEESIFVGVAN